jgi:hypothetical protein
MRRFSTASFVLATLVALGAGAGNPTAAGVLTSFDGAFQVGIDPLGNLVDAMAGIGFLRVADGYDPIANVNAREAWGVSAGGTSGFSDPSFLGVAGIVADGPPLFFNDYALISTFLQDDNRPLLRVQQYYRFADGYTNILRIEISIQNVSGMVQHVRFRRAVAWNMAPTFDDITLVPPLPVNVNDASYWGFESADPLIPFNYSAAPFGGTFGPDIDYGAGVQLDFGMLAADASKVFVIYHAINLRMQTPAALAAQGPLATPGNFVVLGFGSGMAPNSAVLAALP